MASSLSEKTSAPPAPVSGSNAPPRNTTLNRIVQAAADPQVQMVVLDGVTALFKTASDYLNGSPLSIVCSGLEHIQQVCEHIASNKERAERLAGKAADLHRILRTKLELWVKAAYDDENLDQGFLTDLYADLESLQTKIDQIDNHVSKWARYGRFKHAWSRKKLDSKLGRYEDSLGWDLQRFTFQVTVRQIIQGEARYRKEENQWRKQEREWRLNEERHIEYLTHRQEVVDFKNAIREGNSFTDPGNLISRAHKLMEFTSIPEDRRNKLVAEVAAMTKLAIGRYVVEALPKDITLIGNFPKASGRTSACWQGIWRGHTVAIKSFVGLHKASDAAATRFVQEAKVWSNMEQHENILQLYALVPDTGLQLGDGMLQATSSLIHVISPWINNGTIKDYLKRADKFPPPNRHRLLQETAQGIAFLHKNRVIHGNIKCSNIMISDQGVAMISDFGVSQAVEHAVDEFDEKFKQQWRSHTDITLLFWTAPELLLAWETTPDITPMCDVYSFAMTMIECYSGRDPWAPKYSQSTNVYDQYLKKNRPPIPDDDEFRPSDNIKWATPLARAVIEVCWSDNPSDRPTMAQVVSRLEEVSQQHEQQMQELEVAEPSPDVVDAR